MSVVSLRRSKIADVLLIFIVTFILNEFDTVCYSTEASGLQNQSVELHHWSYLFKDLPDDISSHDTVQWNAVADLRYFPSTSPTNIVWLKTTLPQWHGNSPSVFMNSAKERMEVFLGGKKLYDNREFLSTQDQIHALAFRYYQIPLPDSCSGKELYFRCYSTAEDIGIAAPVRLGPAEKFLREIIVSDFEDWFIGLFIFTAGIVITVICLFFQRNRLYTGLSVLLLSTGIYICFNTFAINLFIHQLYWLYVADILVQYFQPFFFLVVEDVVLDRYKKLIHWFWRFNMVYLLLVFVGLLTRVIVLEDTINPYFITLGINTMITLYVLIQSARSRNITTTIVLIGVSILALTGLGEIIAFYTATYRHTVYTTNYVIQWGAFLFTLSLITLLIYRYYDDVNKKTIAEQRNREALQRETNLRERYTRQLLQSQDTERKTIAMELHDAVGQELLIVKNMTMLGLKQLSASRKSPPPKVVEYLNEISTASTAMIEMIRNLSRNLHPYQLESLGLTASLESIITRIQTSSGITFEYSIDPIDKLFSKEAELHLYRIVQECLNNVMKHSGADSVTIAVKREGSTVQFVIQDNGRGFSSITSDQFPGTSLGFGISGIQERVAIIHGTFLLHSNPTEGTMVSIKVPV